MNMSSTTARLPGMHSRLLAGLGLFVALLFLLAAAPRVARADDVTPTSCGKRYVSGGDHIPAGTKIEKDQRYGNHLLFDHLKGTDALPQPWCLRNTAA